MGEKAMINFNALIALQGAANTGKTASISRAFLRTLENKVLVKYFKYYEKGDFVAIAEFKSKYVAFCSVGDVDLEIIERCELLSKEALGQGIKCFDVFIVAHRTSGKTCDFIKECLKQNTQAKIREFKSLTKGEFYDENGGFLHKKMEQHIKHTSKDLYEAIKACL
ncbi:TPA: hypothetical protein R1X56_001269 [Campylobacter upsaliensis]|nr:hypothetical protein [Campylobacter upsaliensis]